MPTRFGAIAALAAALAAPAHAYLFWTMPNLAGAPVVGSEPGVVLPLAGATPSEMQANLVWTLRGGLNVAALQCQFSRPLQTVRLYNNLLRQHAAELQEAYAALNGYFKRTAGKDWQVQLDQYTTRTYNSFSTLNGQLSFCETAGSIGRETMERPRGSLAQIAARRLREFRNSLVGVGDAAFAFRPASLAGFPVEDLSPPPPPRCYNKKGKEIRCKA